MYAHIIDISLFTCYELRITCFTIFLRITCLIMLVVIHQYNIIMKPCVPRAAWASLTRINSNISEGDIRWETVTMFFNTRNKVTPKNGTHFSKIIPHHKGENKVFYTIIHLAQ